MKNKRAVIGMSCILGLGILLAQAGHTLYAFAATATPSHTSKPTPAPTPNTKEISKDLLARLSKSPVKSIDHIQYNGVYAIAIYNTGESGGAALYKIVKGRWNYRCVSKGAFDQAYAVKGCGLSASEAKTLFPYGVP